MNKPLPPASISPAEERMMSLSLEAAMVYDGRVAVESMTIPLRSQPDEELVASARTGSADAFEELVRRYRNDVYALSYHYTRNREEAWDISQEVFIKAWRALAGFRGEAGFKTWLMRITANQCKDHLKKRRVPTVEMAEEDGQQYAGDGLDPGERAEASDLGKAIDLALEGLPEIHRTAFVLREFHDMSYQEMAEVMQCNLGTVMSRLHHARKKLQQTLLQSGALEGRPDGH